MGHVIMELQADWIEKGGKMVISVILFLLLLFLVALALVISKRTLIDEEGKRTTEFFVSKDEEGNQSVHPLR